MRKFQYFILAVAVALIAASCGKDDGGKKYTSPCADLEVKGVIMSVSGAALPSMKVTIAHTVKGSTSYTSSAEDVVTTAADGSFYKKYVEFYPPYDNLELIVTDPAGKYKEKRVYFNNLYYDDARGLYEGFAVADFQTIKVY